MSTRKLIRSSFFGAVLLLILQSPAAWAQGRPFEALQQQINQLQAQISTLQSALATETSARMAADAALQAQVGQGNGLAAIAPYVSLETVNGHPTVRFSAVNVQVVNRLNATDSVNGTGNLLIGYDEPQTQSAETCSLGTDAAEVWITDAAACTTAGGTWAVSHKSGSHNLVVGPRHNYSRAAGVVFGRSGTVNGRFATVIGGDGNTASGFGATISGGGGNYAVGILATVSAGSGNVATGAFASVSGGQGNRASGGSASVSGGEQNTASDRGASVSGGGFNFASNIAASVSGGQGNIASGVRASVSGGADNTAGGDLASVSGGFQRSAPNLKDWAAGGLFQDF